MNARIWHALVAYSRANLIVWDVAINAFVGGATYQTMSCRIGLSIRDSGWASHVPWPKWWLAHCEASIYETIV